MKEVIQPLTDTQPPCCKEPLVRISIEQPDISRNTLRIEGCCTGLLHQRRKVPTRRLVADLPIGLPADKGKVRDVIGLTRRKAALQHRLRENMMKLQAVLRTMMAECNGEV